MNQSPPSTAGQSRFLARSFLILLAVGTAVAVPILPLRFLGIPGPDFGNVSQVVTTSRNWLSKVASRIEAGAETAQPGMPPPLNATPAEQVTMLETAARQLTQEIEKSPCDPALQNRLGLVCISLGEMDKATERFQKAISLCRLGLTAITDKIAGLRRENRTQEASQAVIEASGLNVELSAAHSNLARLYEKRGEHDKVIAELDLLNKEGMLFDNSAVQAVAGAPAQQQNMLNPAVARSLARAEALMQARQFPMAADEFRHVLAQDPNVALAHHRLGTIMIMSGQGAQAVDELEAAGKLDSGSPEVQADLGYAYQMVGQGLPAMKAYERALALEPRETEAAVNLSNIYSSCGRLEDAIAVLSQAVQNNPRSAQAHNNLATLYSLDEKWAPALSEFQKAEALDPNMASAHYGLGTVLMQSKSYTAAIAEFKQALALQPNLMQAQMKIDEATRKIGMTVGSAQALN